MVPKNQIQNFQRLGCAALHPRHLLLGGGGSRWLYIVLFQLFPVTTLSLSLSVKLNVFVPSSHAAPLISAQRENKKKKNTWRLRRDPTWKGKKKKKKSPTLTPKKKPKKKNTWRQRREPTGKEKKKKKKHNFSSKKKTRETVTLEACCLVWQASRQHITSLALCGLWLPPSSKRLPTNLWFGIKRRGKELSGPGWKRRARLGLTLA